MLVSYGKWELRFSTYTVDMFVSSGEVTTINCSFASKGLRYSETLYKKMPYRLREILCGRVEALFGLRTPVSIEGGLPACAAPCAL